MVDKKSLLVIEEQLEFFRGIQYDLKVRVDYGKHQIIGLVGLGLMNLRKIYKDQTDIVVGNIRNVLGKEGHDNKREYFEFFSKSLDDGVEVRELDRSERKNEMIENFYYWFLCIGRMITGGGDGAKQFSEKNEDFWKVFCEKIGVCLIVDSDKGIHCYGEGKEFAVFYLMKVNNDYILMLGADLFSPAVRKGYSDLVMGNIVVNKLLRLGRKVLSKKKKEVFIENTQNLSHMFHLEPEILEYSYSLEQQYCDHKYLILYKPLCKNFHCVNCLFDHCKEQDSNAMTCNCTERLSPKNFCELSQLYIKIQKKAQKSVFFHTSNLATLTQLAHTYCQNYQINEEKSEKCSVCSMSVTPGSLITICKNHAQCKSCLFKDKEKCLFCRKIYSNPEKNKLLNITST